MTLDTALTLFSFTVTTGWFTFGVLCATQWWKERKERAEDSHAFRKAVHQVSVKHLNTAKAQAWEEGYQDGKHDQIMEPMIEAGRSTPITNPYKETH